MSTWGPLEPRPEARRYHLHPAVDIPSMGRCSLGYPFPYRVGVGNLEDGAGIRMPSPDHVPSPDHEY